MSEYPEQIERYRNAYHALHGKYPEIERRGSWWWVGGRLGAGFRTREFSWMASQLEYKAELENREEAE